MSEAYVVDKNLGQPLLLEEGDLPQKKRRWRAGRRADR